jgi:hypothetical protein
MLRRAAIVFVFALVLGSAFAVPKWLSAPPKVKELAPSARLSEPPSKSPDGPATALVAPPAFAKASADASDYAPVASGRSDDGRVSQAVEPATEKTSVDPAAIASDMAPSPTGQGQMREDVPSTTERPVEAPPTARAPTASGDAKGGSVSAPVQETPLPAPLRTNQAVAHIPSWLTVHVGDQDGQVAKVVLQRARALYQHKVSDGQVKNSCYFAMDATRPNVLSRGQPGRRFYIICERERLFRAISAGHGSGRKLKGVADFSNGRSCVKNFGNALDSRLTAGGAYLTSETKMSFKGYYQLSAKKSAPFSRTFIQYDGEGDTANARERQIGGHAAEVLKAVCRRKDPKSPYADRDGYVPFGKLVDYSSGRSDGCTSWSTTDAKLIVSMVKGNPTTLYIYPEESDIDSVAAAVTKGRSITQKSLYWNKTCLKEIGSPKFWSNATLGPLLAQYKKDHSASPGEPLPICKK